MTIEQQPLTVMTYSHDGFGLGHMRRNASIACRFVREVSGASVLMLVGCPRGVVFDISSEIDFVKLPSIIKVGTNTWYPRSLNISCDKTRRIRASLIENAVELFVPDLFLVDHVPTGAWGELLPTLRSFRSMEKRPKVVLGLRDILDAPELVRDTWTREGIYDAIDEYYDEVFIYGCREVYDTAALYGLDGTIADKVRYCGYVCTENEPRNRKPMPDLPKAGSDKFVVVTAGGGYDAYPMMAASIEAIRLLPVEQRPRTIVFTGPLMIQEQRENLQERAAGLPVRVLDWAGDNLDYVAAADLVVTMGGYNSLMESVRLGKRTLVIPREGPSTEQSTRARLLAELGLVHWMKPDEVTPPRLAKAIWANLGSRSAPSNPLDMDGLVTTVGHMKRLLDIDHTLTKPIERMAAAGAA